MIKKLIKKNKIIVSVYEEFDYLKCYVLAKRNCHKEQKMLSVQDRRNIEKYRNIHKGKRCFIVGTGPSLNVNDLEMIKDEISFTVNTGYKAYERTNWRANYYVIMDESTRAANFLQEVISDENNFESIFCSAFIGAHLKNKKVNLLPTDAASVFMFDTLWNKICPKAFPIAQYSSDIAKKVYCGKTVIYACIQIAAYMGFSDIYLLGVDCDYDKTIIHSELTRYDISDTDKKRVVKSGVLMRRQFNELAKILPKYKVKVYNATRGGALEAFPRVNLENLIKKRK